MKIDRLNIKAYGNLTDIVLDFVSETPGLHIVYGPNEAGKSTALRALKGFLYGIPVRTSDDFIHDYNKLKVGGTLVNSDGKVQTLWRLKKKVGDLLDENGEIVEESVIQEFLHGIESSLFTSLFGIDHQTLETGGKDILEQKGEVGQALFSAGAGISALHGVIKQLENDHENLFKASGSKPELNRAIKEFSVLKKDIRDLSLSSSAWKEQEKIFKEATTKLEEIMKGKRASSTELEGLKRLQRALSYLAKRNALLEKLSELKAVEHLPEDFAQQVETNTRDEQEAREKLDRALKRQNSLNEKLDSVSVKQGVLDQAETIEDLYQRLGAQRKALADRPGLNEDMIKSSADAKNFLNQAAPGLDFSQTEKIKSVLAKKVSVIKQGNEHARLQANLEQTETREKDLIDALTKAKKELKTATESIETQGLATSVNLGNKAGDIDDRISVLEQEADELNNVAEIQLQQLGLWNGFLEDLMKSSLPTSDSINRFADNFRERNDALRVAQNDLKDQETVLGQIGIDLKTIAKTGVIPTEKDLLAARDRRDKGWDLIQKAWLKGETVSKEVGDLLGDVELPEAFEESIQVSDDLADRLRNEAERVHKYADLLVRAEALEQGIEKSKKTESNAIEKIDELDSSWEAIWKEFNIEPLPPKEMLAWHGKCEEIRRQLKDALKKESQIAPLYKQRHSLRAALLREIDQINRKKKIEGEELASVLEFSERILRDLIEDNDKRSSLEDRLKEISVELELAEGDLKQNRLALENWQRIWVETLSGSGISDGSNPEEAVEAFEMLHKALQEFEKTKGFQGRIDAIDNDKEEFEKQVKALVQTVAEDLKDLPAEQAVNKLQATLTDVRKASSVKEKLEQDLEEVLGEISQAEADLKIAQDKKGDLVKLANCESEGMLSGAARRFQEYLKSNEDLQDTEESLLGISEGIPIEELEKQGQEIDPDSLPARIAALETKIENEIDPEMQSLSEQKGEAKRSLEIMDGSADAALKQEEAQSALAKVRSLAEQYVRLKLAAKILRKEIDRYRKEHQDPILKFASKYFNKLTAGSFENLLSDFDDNGNQILVGSCGDDTFKTVEEMSSGTRDQLYLALRLATLEWRLDSHEPMPFIADDVLVNFDDERSEAALQALATLAEKNQVILFTHHKAVVELAKLTNGKNGILVHTF